MVITFFSVSFAAQHLEPRTFRPRFTESLLFKAIVPHNKCLGLQHGGLSQEWRTNFTWRFLASLYATL
jgi:hypothetical protein